MRAALVLTGIIPMLTAAAAPVAQESLNDDADVEAQEDADGEESVEADAESEEAIKLDTAGLSTTLVQPGTVTPANQLPRA